MSFPSEKFSENFGGKSWLQRSNVPTDDKIKNYLFINHVVTFFKFCWNLEITLELVGTTYHPFRVYVGTKKSSNGVQKSSNGKTAINNQLIRSDFGLLLERWNVGARNDRHSNQINFL